MLIINSMLDTVVLCPLLLCVFDPASCFLKDRNNTERKDAGHIGVNHQPPIRESLMIHITVLSLSPPPMNQPQG